MKNKRYSAIIPVYNSEKIVEKTVKRCLQFFDEHGFDGEVVLVNDGSKDNSWEVLAALASKEPRVRAINFLKNYGQHTAVFCGIKHAKGDFMITLDDDLQNPPEEMLKLIEKVNEGYDLVFAKFAEKKHSAYRRLGSKMVGYLNEKVFDKPKDIVLTNFRIFSKEVATRMLRHRTASPYIPGLLLLYSSKIGNVLCEHHEREEGTSNYSLIKILKLIARLLFNYSSYPLKVLTSIGFFIATLSFLWGAFYIGKAVFVGTKVAGWTTIVALLSFFNGFTIIMLGVLGEYVSRLMNQVSVRESYEVQEVLNP